jgi:hypothetical protein
MPYLSLPNFNYDSGPRRIQSGPDHEGYVVLYSGVQSTGPDEGIVVAGAPLSGTLALGAWDYDANWRYVPSTLPSQSGGLDPTPYNVSGALDTYDATRIYTRNTVAGAQIASAIGPETGSTVNRPEKYMYFGGAAPDNQNYSPYNTPDANSAAEGKTGGGVTHKTFESSLLTNVLGSQGTSDRSQWRYHQPVYCKTYTETKRSEVPGLMSTPLRAVYRGGSTSYNYNYGGELLANRGGFELLPPDDQTLGCPFPVGCPTNSGSPTQLIVGDILSAVVYCDFAKIEWFNSDNTLVGSGLTYTTTLSDVGYRIFFTVTYADNSTDSSSLNCFPVVIESSLRYWYRRAYSGTVRDLAYSCVVDNNGDMYVARSTPTSNGVLPAVYKISNEVTQQWGKVYPLDPAKVSTALNAYGESYFLLNSGETYIDFLAWQWSPAGPPYGVTYPIRIYRYRISKVDGSVINVASVDFTPPGSPSELYITIKDVKIDSENNYYFIGSFPINSETLTYSICKFTENLTFVWARGIPLTVYRTGLGDTLCAVTQQTSGSLFISLTINDDGIIGCVGFGSIQRTAPNYFSLDANGNTLSVFKPKFSTPNFPSDLNPFLPRSVCRDSEGNIYGIGGYDGSIAIGTYSPVVVYKDSPSDTTIWAKDIRNMISIPSRSSGISVQGNQLLVVNSKLVLVAPWVFFGTFSNFYLLICVFNLETGDLEEALELVPPSDIGGTNMIIQALPEESKFIVQTGTGYRIRLDVNDLPPNGTYLCSDNANKYTASGVVPVTSDHTFYRFTCPTTAGLITRDLGAYFNPVTPVVTISGATGGVFQNFAGQDTP